jgi:hypothetical protein
MDQGVRLRPIYTAARGQILDGEDLVDHLSNDHAYPIDRLDAASDPALLRLHRVDHATGRADHHHRQDIASSVREAAVEAIYRELREALTLTLRAAVPAFEQAILTTLDDAVVNHLDQLAALVPAGDLASDPVTAPALRVTALPDGQLRVWEPHAAQNDLGPMYVLDVFGITVLVRQRTDGLYVHIDGDAESQPVSRVLLVEVQDGGESEHSLEPGAVAPRPHAGDPGHEPALSQPAGGRVDAGGAVPGILG